MPYMVLPELTPNYSQVLSECRQIKNARIEQEKAESFYPSPHHTLGSVT